MNIQMASELCGISTRTLQRRLADSRSSLTRIIDHARFLKVEALLADSSVRLLEIAYELGYSDPAHFTRAFRRWAGVSPSAYRKEHHHQRASR